MPLLSTDPRYPIGPFSFDITVSAEDRARYIEEIAALPREMAATLEGLADSDRARRYRPGGWTIQELVHHVADSHLNGYARWKFALTEDAPTIKPYDEERWARLADVHATPLETSLTLLTVLHERWVALVRSLAPTDFARTYVHPQHGRGMSLDLSLANYAWHGRHHTAHIRVARESGVF